MQRETGPGSSQPRQGPWARCNSRHEDKGYLDEGYNSKVEKDTPLLEILAEQLEVERGRFLPLVVGTRGSPPLTTIDYLREININDRGSYIIIFLLALTHSI